MEQAEAYLREGRYEQNYGEVAEKVPNPSRYQNRRTTFHTMIFSHILFPQIFKFSLESQSKFFGRYERLK